MHPRPAPAPPPGARVTAAMVAAEAGVSTATVSLVVSGKADGRVSAANQAKVRAAVDRLGYVVDRAASSLSKGSGSVVVLVATDIANPFYSELIAAARAALGERFELLLSVSGPGHPADPDSIRRLLSLRPAGFLLDAPTPELVAALPAGTPAVLLDAPGLTSERPRVDLDVAAGAVSVAEHLAAAGHRDVAYLGSVIDAATFRARREAFLEAAERLGMTVHGEASCLTEVQAAREAFDAAWPGWRRDGVSAVVCCTDTHAYGVLEGAGAAGVQLPGELAVTGFDDLPSSRLTAPPLTSVRLPSGELGAQAGRALLAAIEGGDAGAAGAEVLLPAELVVRTSSAGSR